MGLDMYLYLRKYESVSRDKIRKGFYPKDLNSLMQKQRQRNYLSRFTMYQIGYWRKANAIHKWIVDNCGDGIDECQKIYVSAAKLKELGDLCNEVLNDHSKAEELLPTCSGFFFGGTEYDDWYFQDILYTAELIAGILPLMNKYDCIYQANW